LTVLQEYQLQRSMHQYILHLHKFDFDTFDGYFWVHDNIKGDQGSHYFLECLWNYYTFDVITLKLTTPGN